MQVFNCCDMQLYFFVYLSQLQELNRLHENFMSIKICEKIIFYFIYKKNTINCYVHGMLYGILSLLFDSGFILPIYSYSFIVYRSGSEHKY